MSTQGNDLRRMQQESDAEKTRLVGHHDLNGSGDGMQVVKRGKHLYVAHVGTSKMALSILDVSDPSNPRLLRQIPHAPNTHNHKVQIVGDVLVQNSEYISYLPAEGSAKPVAGLNVYSIEDPENPEQIGFYSVGERGVHRTWYREAPYAHIAAPVEGSSARGYHIVDLSDPAHPKRVGCWWVPGSKAGDSNPWEALDPVQNKLAVHGVIPQRNRAYASCTDGGMAILDISDMSRPKLLSRINWCPPYGGYSHTSLPLPGRDLLVEVSEWVNGGRERNGDKRIWLIDIREERQPVMISSFPLPQPPKNSPWRSFHDRSLKFGPHNVHENYRDGFQSETLIFSSWFNAGLRITDISDADRPIEVGRFVPPAPAGQEAPQINDLYVDKDNLVYLTDRVSGGLYIVEHRCG